MKVKGTVKWFNDTKGFGYATQDNGGPDVMVHYDHINQDGFKTLIEGQKIELEVEMTNKGPQGRNIVVL